MSDTEEETYGRMKEIGIAELSAMIGQEIGISSWITLTQEMIDRFAEATCDHQFIHVDPERAASTAFGGTIAHGFLTLSLLPVMKTDALPALRGQLMEINYGFNRLRMIAPVPAGRRIRGRFVLVALDERRPGEALVTYDVTIEIDGMDKPAVRAEWLGLCQFVSSEA